MRKLPFIDYSIWFLARFLGVLVFTSCYPLAGILCFFLIRHLAPTLSFFFVNTAILGGMLICLVKMRTFDSRWAIFWQNKKWSKSPISKIPHPIVIDVVDTDPSSLKIKRRLCVIVMELKALAASMALLFVILYSVLVYYDFYTRPKWFGCVKSCYLYGYIIKSLGSNVIFDFFDEFHIRVTNIVPTSVYVEAISFLSRIVFTYVLVRAVVTILRFRRRFGPLFRPSALSTDDYGFRRE